MDEGKFLTVCKLCGERALPLGAEPPERGWDGAPGPVTRRLSQLYWQKREAGWHGTPVTYDDALAAP